MPRTFVRAVGTLGFCLVQVLSVAAARGDIVPAPIFGDGMVLQRDRPVPIWGRATPGETVTVSFGGQKVSGKADADGRWKVAMQPLAADASQTMRMRKCRVPGRAARIAAGSSAGAATPEAPKAAPQPAATPSRPPGG